MRSAFIYLEADEVLVNVDDIVTVRPITEGDIDVRTGMLIRSIPENTQTRIDLRGTWVYVSLPVTEVVEHIRKVVQP